MDTPSIDEVLLEMREQRRIQSDAIQVLDNKIGFLVPFIGVFIALVVHELKFSGIVLPILSAACLLTLFLALLFSVLSLWVRSFRYNPAPKVLIDDYMFRDPNDWEGDTAGSKEQMLADQVESYRLNGVLLECKSDNTQRAMLFLLIGGGCFVMQYLYSKLVPIIGQLIQDICRGAA